MAAGKQKAGEHTYDGYDIAREEHARYIRARDAGHKDFVRDAMKFDEFYRGEQWDAQDVAKLEAQGRPASTINLVLPTINTMVGEFMNQQADIQFKPRRGQASEEVASTLTKLAMHVTDANSYEFVEKDILEDGLITGRGYFDVRIDFSDNVLGEVRIQSLDPREVIPDPTAREYDPATWNEVITTRWMSLDELAVIYGEDKAEELRYYQGAGTTFNDDTIKFEERGNFGDEHALFQIGAYDDMIHGRTIKSIRIVERQFYRLARVKEFVDPVQGDTRPVPESWNQEKIQLYSDAKGLLIRERLTRKVRWRVTADCVMLHDSWSPYPTFTVVPFFCYFRRGKPFGAMKNLVDPQKIVNKVESQMLHVVNTTANSGWIVDAGALANMTVDELAARGAETGLVIERNPGREIEKIHPNAVPSGLDNISVRNIGLVREISGVNAAMMGLESASVSGVALENKQIRGSVQLQTVRENLKRTRKLVANKILELVQRFYTEERVFRITGYDGDTEELVVNARDAAGQIVNDLTLGEYEVVVAAMPARDNFEETQFAQALSLRDAGIAIPDHRVIQYSGLHRRQELVEEVKNMTGFGEPSPQQQMMQELQFKALQAEVENLIADVEQKRSAAMLNTAKAQSEAEKPALEREQMQADMAITAEEQSTRMAVQRLKEMSSQLQKILDTQTKVRVEDNKANAAANQRRKPDAGSKPKPRRK
jgi:hypothetical protein